MNEAQNVVLQGQEQLLRAIAGSLPDGRSAQDLQGLLQKVASQVPGVVYQYKLRPDGSSCFPYASEQIRRIYHVSPASVREDASIVLDRIHPDDLLVVQQSIQDSASSL